MFKLLLFSFLLLAVPFCSKIAAAQMPGELHLVSYNVFNGFEHGNKLQQENFINWVKKQKPDILALQELVDLKASDLKALAGSYGHQYAVILKEEGYPVGITSKFPIEIISKQTKDFWHGVLHVRVAGLHIIVTHLSPFEWKFRKKEAERIISYIKEKQLDSCIIMGDLNAHSPLDADELATHRPLKQQMQLWDKNNPSYGNLKEGRFDYSVIATFLSAGFEDAIGRLIQPAALRMTFPAAFLYGWGWGDNRLKPLSERLDYILVTDNLFTSCIQATVHNGQDTEGIFDHYPVSIILQYGK